MRSFVLIAVVTTAACITTPTLAQQAVRTEFVDPLITGPGITPLSEIPNAASRDLRHFIAVQSPPPAPRQLYVHLVGTGGVPANSQEIIMTAAELGYHAVSIAYHDFPSVAQLGASTFNVNVYGDIRRERLFGEDLSTLVNVTPPDSVVGRLVSLLNYLITTHPAEAWGAFLAPDGTPLWSRIVVGGHSQGAGHAAYLTKEFKLAGAILFAGVGDYHPALGWASWIALPTRTPLSRVYALTHLQDPFASVFFPSQIALHIPGSLNPLLIDGLTINQITSHTLSTDAPLALSGDAHGSVVVDSELPRDAAGAPLYRPVWERMLRVKPADINGDGVTNGLDLAAVLNSWGTNNPAADVSNDGVVNGVDLAFVLSNWG